MYSLVVNGNRSLTMWVADIYRDVAKAYAMLLQFIDGSDVTNNITGSGQSGGLANLLSEIETISGKLYVLVGVFMLFRLGISLIQYLINPEQLDDKQVGGGKLVSRIIISAVLIISLQTFVFGWLRDFQDALLDDSIIDTLFQPETATNIDNNNDIEEIAYNKKIEKFKMINPLITNVNAATNFDCYYTSYSVSTNQGGTSRNQYGPNYVKIRFYKQGGGIRGETNQNDVNLKGTGVGDANKTDWYVRSDSQTFTIFQELSRTTNTVSFSAAEVGNASVLSAINAGTCPQYFTISSNRITFRATTGITPDYTCGRNTSTGMLNCVIAAVGKEFPTSSSSAYTYMGDESLAEALRTANIAEVNTDAMDWAREVVQVFADPPEALSEFLTEKNSEIATAAENEEFTLNFFLAIIVGIALIVFLWILSIEVIVRNLKLLFLQVIAPIPVICYINPNDKIFGEWLKQYAATYFDLFLKLVSIKAGVWFMKKYMVMLNGEDAIWKLFIIAGSLLFIKTLPNMLSKLFGLDAAGGTFKDSFGLVKRGLGIGAGAVAGAGAGLITGGMAFAASRGQSGGNRVLAGLMGIGSGLSGMVRGGVGGASGKLLNGAKTVGFGNLAKRQAMQNGATAGQIASSALLGGIGLAPAQVLERQMNEVKRRMAPVKQHQQSLSGAASSLNSIKERALKKVENREATGAFAQNYYDHLGKIDATKNMNLSELENAAFNDSGYKSRDASGYKTYLANEAEKLKKSATEEYINTSLTTVGTDAVIDDNKETFQNIVASDTEAFGGVTADLSNFTQFHATEASVAEAAGNAGRGVYTMEQELAGLQVQYDVAKGALDATKKTGGS